MTSSRTRRSPALEAVATMSVVTMSVVGGTIRHVTATSLAAHRKDALMTLTAGSTFGQSYAASLRREQRRTSGVVYTPDELVDMVIDRALRGRDELLDGVILDPACGAGAFLVAILRRIGERLTRIGVDVASRAGRDVFIVAAETQIRGYDIDPCAVELAKDALRAEFQIISPGPVPSDFLGESVKVADFILGRAEVPAAERPDLVLGNPPYVPVDRLPQDLKHRLRSTYATATGRIDLYTVFLERASQEVAEDGRVAFITPDKYLTSQSARKLREHLVGTGHIDSLTLFDSHKLFPEVATVPCVTVWDRGAARSRTQVMRCSTSEADSTISIRSVAELGHDRFLGDQWRLSSTKTVRLADRIKADHPRLRDRVERVSAGIATGYNRAFLLAAEDTHGVEPLLLYPTAGGRDIVANAVKDRGQRLLMPYTWDEDGIATLIDLDEYPGAGQWLARHAEPLRRRHCVRVWNKAWWDVHDPVGEPLHRRAKVLVPDLAKTNRFAADIKGIVPQHSVYYLLPRPGEDVRVLSALLNSVAVQYLIHDAAPLAKDGFRRYRRQFLLDLPVPELNLEEEKAVLSLLVSEDRSGLLKFVDEVFGVAADHVRRQAAIDGVNL